jgi:hypothetical protein
MSSKSQDVKVFPGDESKKFLLLQRTIQPASALPFAEDPPYDLNEGGNFATGVDVTKWHSITVTHACFRIAEFEANNTVVTFIPWRYYRAIRPYVGPVGVTLPPEGGWIAEAEATITLDPMGNPITQQNVYATLNCDRMCFQITSVVATVEEEAVGSNEEFVQSIFGVTPRPDDGSVPSVVGSAGGGGGGGGGTVVIPDPVNTNTIQLAGNPIDLGAGNVGAGTQRVTIADDDNLISSIDTNIAAILVDTSAILVDTGNIDTNVAAILVDTGNIETAVQIIDDWDAVHDSVAGTDGVRVEAYASDSQVTAVSANGDDVRMAASRHGELYDASHTYPTQSNRSEEIDPANQWYEYSTLAAVTNGTDGTYYYYIPMAGYMRLDMQAELSGGTGTIALTVEGSIQADGTAPASLTYQDVTNLAYGSASFAATNMLIDNTQFFGAFNYVRVKIVAAATNTADWTLYIKKTWE